MNTRLAALLLALVPLSAYAHPGHGTSEPESLRHYVIEPVHVALFVIVLMTVIAFRAWRPFRRPDRADE